MSFCLLTGSLCVSSWLFVVPNSTCWISHACFHRKIQKRPGNWLLLPMLRSLRLLSCRSLLSLLWLILCGTDCGCCCCVVFFGSDKTGGLLLGKSIFWKLFRPEFVLSRKRWRPLSSDALSTFAYSGPPQGTPGTRQKEGVATDLDHNAAVVNATAYLLNVVVPHLSKQLIARGQQLVGSELSR